jgi:hypothetical protein
VAEWSCSGLQSRLRRFDSDPSLIFPVLRRSKKINGVAKSPESPENPAYRRLELFIDRIARGGYMAGVSQDPTTRYPTFAIPVLNEAKIRSARPQERAYKLFDERGLFMLMYPM